MEFYQAQRITSSTTKIVNIGDVACFLVEGTERAVLIDSGTGAGNLKAFVESLTEKPVSVILTHGHCDHASGAAPFQQVYLSEADWALAAHHASMEMKKGYVEYILGERYSELKEDDFCPERTSGYLPLRDGQLFGLGGITLEAIAVPGHTHGMTCILNLEERSILFGDACNPSVFLLGEESLSVEAYRDSLLHLKRHENRYDTVYLSHGSTTVDKRILDQVIHVCDEIMRGEDDAQAFSFMDYTDLKLAKATDANRNRLDGGIGNIVYRDSNITLESERR